MSDLSTTSYYKDKGCDNNGISPILLIVLLLCLCGGDNGLFGGSCGFGGDSCGCGGKGFDGILPLILILCLCGGF